MKSLTTLDVKTVADELIASNGTTTTLEVKNELRTRGFWAVQTEVSAEMSSLGYPFTDNSGYRTYGVSPVISHMSKTVSKKSMPKGTTSLTLLPGGEYEYIKRDGTSVLTVDHASATHVAFSSKSSDVYYFANAGRNNMRYMYSKLAKVPYKDTRINRV